MADGAKSLPRGSDLGFYAGTAVPLTQPVSDGSLFKRFTDS